LSAGHNVRGFAWWVPVAKILLVEDDQGLCRMIRDWLTMEKHNLEIISDGKEALERLKYYQFDLVILDWELPGMHGPEILKEFRDAGKTTPVIMLTGKSTIENKEAGFGAGADDYLTKPFAMKELSVRLRALLRRPGSFTGNVITMGNFVLDQANFKLTKNGSEVKLLPREFALMEFFMRHPKQVFSADALLNRVWASDSDSSSDALTTCIKRLRKKLDDEGKPSIITTVHGVGYKLDVG
jgi:DNA-binding response OmpR family regulator